MIKIIYNELSPRVREAYLFAKEAHGGQLDDEGILYFKAHILQTMAIAMQVTDDEDIIIAACLHDVLEDTDVTFKEIIDRFGERVAGLVLEVTHEGEADKYGYFFPHLHSQDGILLKFADRLSNISRMNAWTPERQIHYLGKSKFWKDGEGRGGQDE